MIPCTEHFLADGLRAGRFQGRKIVGRWRLTDETCKPSSTPACPNPKPPMSTFDLLTPGSRRRIERGVDK